MLPSHPCQLCADPLSVTGNYEDLLVSKWQFTQAVLIQLQVTFDELNHSQCGIRSTTTTSSTGITQHDYLMKCGEALINALSTVKQASAASIEASATKGVFEGYSQPKHDSYESLRYVFLYLSSVQPDFLLQVFQVAIPTSIQVCQLLYIPLYV